MEPYEAGMVFGRLAALGCCLLTVLAVIGGIVWAIVHFTRKKSPPAPPPSNPER